MRTPRMCSRRPARPHHNHSEELAPRWIPLGIPPLFRQARGHARQLVLSTQSIYLGILWIFFDALGEVLKHRGRAQRLLMGGDWNLPSLHSAALRQDPPHVPSPGDDRTAVDMALDMIRASRLRLLCPAAGFADTFLPYARHMRPKVLDHIVVDDVTATQATYFTIESEAAAASFHFALRATFDLAPGTARPPAGNRNIRQRRSWEDWQERNPGQIQHLVASDTWESVDDFERQVSRAGRDALGRPTTTPPFTCRP